MNGAVAVALLAAMFVASGTLLVIFDEDVAGWVMLALGILGWLIVVSMSISDARDRGFPPPRA